MYPLLGRQQLFLRANRNKKTQQPATSNKQPVTSNQNMKYVGAHVSAEGGVQNAPVNAHGIGAKAFALFTRNQRQWFSAPLTQSAITDFRKNCE